MKLKMTKIDPLLKKYQSDLDLRMENYVRTKSSLLAPGQTLSDFANGHLFYGIHRCGDGWVYREWAPGAEAMYLTGDFNNWDRHGCPMEKLENGVFQVFLPGKDTLRNGQRSWPSWCVRAGSWTGFPSMPTMWCRTPGT